MRVKEHGGETRSHLVKGRPEIAGDLRAKLNSTQRTERFCVVGAQKKCRESAALQGCGGCGV
jgi:hypothetical protein